MNNELDSRGVRGQITQFVKEKGQVIASSAVIAGIGIAGAADAISADNSNDDADNAETALLAGDVYLGNADSYESLADRMAREAYENAKLQEKLMQENLEMDIEPTATPTPLPTLTPTPVPPTPTQEPYIPPQPTAIENTGVVASGDFPAIDIDDNIWDTLAVCESSSNWSINNGNGFFGGLQFSSGTWLNYGGGEFAPYAHLATREQQIVVAERTLYGQGWAIAWPGCSANLGLR